MLKRLETCERGIQGVAQRVQMAPPTMLISFFLWDASVTELSMGDLTHLQPAAGVQGGVRHSEDAA